MSIARRHWPIIAAALLFALWALVFAPQAGAAKRPPRPCVGVVVRTIEGVEYVRRKDGTACTRPAPAPVVRRKR